MHVHYRNVNDAFVGLVSLMHESDQAQDGETYRTESRNGPVIQFAEPVTVTFFAPTERVLLNEARDANPFFHVFESMWMLAGRNDIKPLTDIVGKYADFSDDGVTANGAYGYRWRHARPSVHVKEKCPDCGKDWGHGYCGTCQGSGVLPGRDVYVDQLSLIATHLLHNPTSRRAVLQMWNVEDDLLKIENSKDVCCNTSVMFSLRETRDREEHEDSYSNPDYVLDMTVTNRSNDLVWGLLGANVVHFSFLQEYMASRIGVEVGLYHHFTNNLHAYEWNWKPEEWLKENKNRNMHSSVSPYDSKDFRHVSLTADEDFEQEVKWFVESPVMANVTGGFLNNVAYPMMSAHSLYKQERYEEAVRATDKIKALDWRIASLGWLKRRIEKKLQKGGVA